MPKAKKKKQEEVYRLSPKGIFTTCLMDIFDISIEDRRIALSWELFESRMKQHGYVSEE